MPSPDIAAWAARLRLGRAAELPPLPAGHRVWRTGLDSFGQSLEALGRPELTEREALALVVTEAARPLIRPGEKSEGARLMAALAGFELTRPLTLDSSVLAALAAANLGPEYDGTAFFARAGELSAKLGFKIAVP
jgi:hypothetical protein